ncbi:LAFE_0G11628g1_1 [Lachancea fermentati]|uniref:LAFE_0G11628g1_1 n=1 Tax=Lachancea fermentati TaxID=4955 RepID=A0A1G4MHV2_LACFM|nr:LAFE_0G11628g1_1 [Lachancea fermentati]
MAATVASHPSEDTMAKGTGRPTPTSEQYQRKFQSIYTRYLEQIDADDENSEEDDQEDANYTTENFNNKTRQLFISAGIQDDPSDQRDLSQQLQDLISSNSELGSRLLSLLLVSSGNAKEIISAVNQGDLGKLKKLDLKKNGKKPEDSKKDVSQYTEEQLNEFKRIELEKRRKNTEASARFRIRKKQREQEKLAKLKQLNSQISELYVTIDKLLDENKFWKLKLEEVNERKSRELLDSIKKRRINDD